MRTAVVCVAILAMAACGYAEKSIETTNGSKPDKVQSFKLLHQIMVKLGEDVQVFEGYMIQKGDSFYVKAFAGPGIDLFTVARKGSAHWEEAHIKALGEKLDLEAVSLDIARAHFKGCEKRNGEKTSECEMLGETLIERYDDSGRVVSRSFPDAYGIGMTVEMVDYRDNLGGQRPDKIVLTWGSGNNKMVIKLVSVELFDGSIESLINL